MERILGNMSRRILLLTQWFDPEPTFKGLVFARELVKQGFDVEVVTGFPNYPGGKLYPGFRIKLLQQDLIDGVKITRVPLYPSHDQGAFNRVLNYVSFSASALIYCLFKAKRADVIYAYHPPLTVGVAASFIRFFRRIPVVYDIQDMWPDTLRATGMITSKQALRIVSSVCNLVYRNVDQVVVLSPGFKRLLIERGVPQNKIEIIYNWCDEEALNLPTKKVPSNFPSADRFKIVFAGNMGKAQALCSVLDAADILQCQGHNNINFTFVGDGLEVARLKAYAQERQLENVCFLPQVSMNEVGSVLKAADALLVHLKSNPLFNITIPSKTQAYMAVGKPILMAIGGDAAKLVKEAACGELAISENPESIAAAALTLRQKQPAELAEMSHNSQKYYLDNLSLKVGVRSFCEIFSRIIDGREVSK